MHELLALAFKNLHFESYLTTRNRKEVLGSIIQERKDLDRVKYQYLDTSIKEFDERTKDYFLYVSPTIKGEKEKTAEFCIKHVQLILKHSRSLCEENLHGCISCLPKFTNIFFALIIKIMLAGQ